MFDMWFCGEKLRSRFQGSFDQLDVPENSDKVEGRKAELEASKDPEALQLKGRCWREG